MTFVIDASAAIAWALREDDPRAERAHLIGPPRVVFDVGEEARFDAMPAPA